MWELTPPGHPTGGACDDFRDLKGRTGPGDQQKVHTQGELPSFSHLKQAMPQARRSAWPADIRCAHVEARSPAPARAARGEAGQLHDQDERLVDAALALLAQPLKPHQMVTKAPGRRQPPRDAAQEPGARPQDMLALHDDRPAKSMKPRRARAGADGVDIEGGSAVQQDIDAQRQAGAGAPESQQVAPADVLAQHYTISAWRDAQIIMISTTRTDRRAGGTAWRRRSPRRRSPRCSSKAATKIAAIAHREVRLLERARSHRNERQHAGAVTQGFCQTVDRRCATSSRAGQGRGQASRAMSPNTQAGTRPSEAWPRAFCGRLRTRTGEGAQPRPSGQSRIGGSPYFASATSPFFWRGRLHRRRE